MPSLQIPGDRHTSLPVSRPASQGKQKKLIGTNEIEAIEDD